MDTRKLAAYANIGSFFVALGSFAVGCIALYLAFHPIAIIAVPASPPLNISPLMWLFLSGLILAAVLHTMAAFVARPSKTMALTLGDGGLDLYFQGMSLRHRHERDGRTFHRITVFNGNARAVDNVEVLLLDVDAGDGKDWPGHYPHTVDSPFTLNPGAHRDVDFAQSWTDATGRLIVEWTGSTIEETELKEGQCWHIRIGAR